MCAWVSVCVFSESYFAKGTCLEIYKKNWQHEANWGTFLSQKEKKKSLVVSGSQILCKMSWDGDHLDKDIPTPPNKMQVRKQEKHTPTHKASQEAKWLKGNNLAQYRRKLSSPGTLGSRSVLNPGGCPPEHPRGGKEHRSWWMWGKKGNGKIGNEEISFL